jgi:predicted RNase H-like HicB family nuclease
MSHQISVVIEKDDNGYYAYCPQLEGCQSQGNSLEVIKVNIQEAVELYLSTLSEVEKQKLHFYSLLKQ